MGKYENEVQALRAKAKGLQAEGVSLQRRIAAASGLDKHCLRRKKSFLGYYARYTLLAYALFRGKTYASTEGSCKNPPDAKRLLKEVEAHSSLMYTTTVSNGRTYHGWRPWTLEAIEGWLSAAGEVSNAAR